MVALGRIVLAVGRAVGCLIFCALLVLLVPSSAWSATTDGPRSSGSWSLLAGSSSVLEDDPTQPPGGESSSPEGETDPSGGSSTPPSDGSGSSPEPSHSPESPEPSAPPQEGGDVQPTMLTDAPCGATAETPCFVEATPGAIGFLALGIGLCALGVLGLFVRSFGS